MTFTTPSTLPPAATAGAEIQGAVRDSYSGAAVAGAGDVNGDGIADVIVGAPGLGGDAGTAYLVFGTSDGFGPTIDLAALGSAGVALTGTASSRAGWSVASAGDINDDGIDDVVVGAPLYDSNRGEAHVVFGRSTGWPSTLELSSLDGFDGFSLTTHIANQRIGYSLAAAGDVNGDGIDDLAIGAPLAAGQDGLVYVVFGRTDGFGAEINLPSLTAGGGVVIGPGGDFGQAGLAIESAGDLNQDGIDDLVVIATGSGEESAFIVFGRTESSPTGVIDLVAGDGVMRIDGLVGPIQEAVAGGGDLNGDGIDDIVIGRQYAGGGYARIGRAYVVFGGTGLPDTMHVSSLDGSNGFALFGISGRDGMGADVDVAGDLNGDGIDDLLVGANFGFLTGTTTERGGAFVLFGRTSAFAATIETDEIEARGGILFPGGADNDYAGGVRGNIPNGGVAFAGDVNGDGGDDILIGAVGHDPLTRRDAGSTYVIFGEAPPPPFGEIVSLPDLDDNEGFTIGGAHGDGLGHAVGGGGDVNGDGFDDLIVGARYAYVDGAASGAAYVVFGGPSGLTGPVELSTLRAGKGFRIQGEENLGLAGIAVSNAGDVNGDGTDDLIVGASKVDGSGAGYHGAAYVVFGQTGGFDDVVLLSDLGAGGVKLRGPESGYAGFSVGDAGDVNGDGIDDLIVGAPNLASINAAGGAYVVFGRTDLQGEIELSALAGGAGFEIVGSTAFPNAGYSVSKAGDVNGDGIEDLIVGAANVALDPDVGTAFVVYGRTGGFPSDLHLTAMAATAGFRIEGIEPLEELGASVSDAGDVNGDGIGDLIVGAPLGGASGAGAAYILFGRDGGFGTVLDLGALAPGQGVVIDGAGYTGISVSGAGDVDGDGFDDVLVGADRHGVAQGEVYVIYGRAQLAAAIDVPTEAADGFLLTAGGTSFLGRSVSDAGDVNADGVGDFIVGAPGNGAAYLVYGRKTLLPTARVTGFEDDTGDVGDRETTDRTLTVSGEATPLSTVHVFRDDTLVGTTTAGLDGSWSFADPRRLGFGHHTFSALAEIDDPEDPGNPLFGEISGAFGLDVVTKPAGTFPSVVVAGALDGENGLIIDGATDGQTIGFSVSGAGDVNGDGIDDVIVGGPWAEPNGFSSGTAYVVFGRSTGLTSPIELSDLAATEGFQLQGGTSGDFAGASVSAAGDVNGDGIGDLLVGAPTAGPGAGNGAAFVVFGRSTGFPDPIVLHFTGIAPSDGFAIQGRCDGDSTGFSVSAAGDVNGDGIDDVIVGASLGTGAYNASGASYVVFGRCTSVGATLELAALGSNGVVIEGAGPSELSGSSVGAAGDVNGDGIADLVIGATNAQGSYLGAGYILFGRSDLAPLISVSSLGAGSTDGVTILGISAGGKAGFSVSGAGDVNGDGIDDVIVGAPGDYGGTQGVAYVVFGRSDLASTIDLATLGGSAGFAIERLAENHHLGVSVSGAGDVNGDGIDDLIAGANFGDAAFVIFGRTTGFEAAIALSGLTGTNGFTVAGSHLTEAGRSVSDAGDVNGDGVGDVIVGAPYVSPTGRAGQAYVIFGRTDVFDITPPDTTITGQPAILTNDATPDFAFTSDEDGTFDISIDGDSFTSVGSDTTYTAPSLGDGPHTFVVRARDGVGNVDPTPATYVFSVDATDPDTTITSQPGDPTNDPTAGFSFEADESATFEVAVDGGGFTTIGSATTYTTAPLSDGTHTFEVRATDAAGNTDDSPAIAIFTVDTDVPDTTIASGPSGLIGIDDVAFDFGSPDDPTAGFEVSLDGTSFVAAVGTTQSYTDLPDGPHTFRVRARDAAGNIDASPASATFTVDTEAPDTTIVSGPSGVTQDDDPVFQFAADEAGVTFEVALNGGGFASVAGSSRAYSDLADGTYTFQVRAIDGLNQVDATPAQRIFTIVSVPAGPVTITGFSEDTGTIGDGATTDRVLTISGIGTPTNLVHVLRDGVEVGTATVSAGGTWSFADPATQSFGRRRFTARSENEGGDDGPLSAPLDVLVMNPAATPSGGPDLLLGTASANVIQGVEGNDSIFGEAGNDTVRGGNGNDLLHGGADHDRLEGGNGADTAHGDSGNDSIYGENGNDRLEGGDGNDRIEAGAGNDHADGGAGNDTLFGGGEVDTLFGGVGADFLFGDAGGDRIHVGDDGQRDSVIGTIAHLADDTIEGFIADSIAGAAIAASADVLFIQSMTNAQRAQIDGDILDAQGRLFLPGGGVVTFLGHAGAEVDAVFVAGGVQVWLLPDIL